MGSRSLAVAVLFLLLSALAAHALSTAFTYQGRLTRTGIPSTGAYSFMFILYDAATGGAMVGEPVLLDGVPVANGLFTVSLDFGSAPFTGADRWLEVHVGLPGVDFSPATLAPRQRLAPTPYALFAKAVNWEDILNRPATFGVYTAGPGLTLTGQEFAIADGGVATAMLADGAVTTAKLADGAVTDAKVADVAWSKITGAPAGFPPTGAAGGDLSGDYPNPAIAAGAVTPAKLAADAAGLAKVTKDGMTMNNGNVGIGTATAGFPLTFANGVGDKISLWGQSGNHYGFGIQNSLLQIYTDGYPAAIAFGYGTSASFTEQMRIKGNGNVGIGTGNPATKLDVNGTVRMVGFQLGTSATAGQVLTASATGVGTWQALPAYPTTLPPSGAAGGDLTGTYPNPILGNDVVTAAKLGDNSVDSAAIMDGVVGYADLANNAVTTDKILDGTVTNAKIFDVAWGKITGAPSSFPPSGTAGGSLTGTYPNPTIAGGAIGTAMLGDSQVTNSKLAADSVTTSKVANGTVTAVKLSSDADSLAKVSGGVLTSNSTQIGVNTATPAAGVLFDVNGKLKATAFQLGSSATAGQVLTADASGNGTWQAPAAYTAGNGLSLSGTQFSVSFGGTGTATTAARSDHSQAWSTLTGVPAGLADGDNDTTYTAGNGLTLTGTSFGANFGGTGTANTVARSDHTQAWSTLTSVPAGLADGDNDTTYTAGNGLTLTGTSFAANFGGTGSATTLSRSDHNHDASYWKLGGNAVGATGVLGTTDNQTLELRVNGVAGLRIVPSANAANLIAGNSTNDITSGYYGASIGGGSNNTISNHFSVVDGGLSNQVSGSYSTIGGGYSNATSGSYTVIAGGYGNTIAASTNYATIGGGNGNQVTANYGTIPGGYSCTADNYAFAAGNRAKATLGGSFVWADSQALDLVSPGTNSVAMRALGGFWLGTNSTPSIPTGRFLNTSTGAYLTTSGTWTNVCDRNMKTDFAALNSSDILRALATLPITSWSYKVGGGERHVGPMAQDFRAAFGLGLDDVSISTVDGIGVALAAAQALEAKVTRLESENAALKTQLADLAARMTALEAKR